jgi:hypothetical protein
MESSGQSEFSNSSKKIYSLAFWQNFILTLAGYLRVDFDGCRWATMGFLSESDSCDGSIAFDNYK